WFLWPWRHRLKSCTEADFVEREGVAGVVTRRDGQRAARPDIRVVLHRASRGFSGAGCWVRVEREGVITGGELAFDDEENSLVGRHSRPGGNLAGSSVIFEDI